MDESDFTTRAWLTLIRAPGVGGAKLRRWLDEAEGDAVRALEAVLAAPLAYGADAAALAWLRHPDPRRLDMDLAWLAQPQHRLLRYVEADFPPLLGEIAGAPVALFVAGHCEALLWPQVAMVGARNASAAGLDHARDFAGTLSASGLGITSGLADGIDGAAHAATVSAGGITIAVMGTGPDRIYPRAHHELAARIVERGALVSEFPPGVEARPHHFPRRNRLIAGLSLGTLVIEAGLRSGSLITARLASEQGREVFALPGSIHNPLARGCHRLIREGARLVETATEVIEALAPLAQTLGARLAERLAQDADADDPPGDAPDGMALDDDYRRLIDAMGHDPVALDVLIERTGLGTAALSSMLLMLELEGLIEPRPGGCYQRR